MHRIAAAVAIVAVTVSTGLGVLRYRDALETGRTWHSVALAAQSQGVGPTRFDKAMLADLPEPVRRYFGFTLAEGVSIPSGVKIAMSGTLALGDRSDAKPMTMKADQILALPHGFVWTVEARSDRSSIVGSDALVDGASWSRFWSFGLLPVGRDGLSKDHWRASFGRMVAEAAFWSPASLLPREGLVWTAVDDTTIRATLTHRDAAQSVDIFLREDGAPVRVETDRWSDANPDREFRLQRFGGNLGDFRTVDGITVPMRVEGGNFIGTPDYVPFYKVEVDTLEFLRRRDDTD